MLWRASKCLGEPVHIVKEHALTSGLNIGNRRTAVSEPLSQFQLAQSNGDTNFSQANTEIQIYWLNSLHTVNHTMKIFC